MRWRNPLAAGHKPFPLTEIYQEAHLAKDIRLSLTMILWANIFGNLFGIICGSGTNTMIGLANYLGAGDLAFGILNAIPQVAVLLQVPFAMLVSYRQKRKRYMLTYGVISRAIFLLFGLVPFFVPVTPAGLQLWVILFLLGISSALSSFINVSWMPWLADLAPITIRGRWFSIRDTVNSIGSVVGGLAVAWLLDTLPGMTKYTILFLLGGLLGVMDMACYAFVKEEYKVPPKKIRFFSMFREIWENKKFFRFMVFWTVWCFTANFAGAYLNRYSVNEMGLTYMQITIFSTIAGSLITVLVIRRWGRLMDLYGNKPVLWIGSIGAALSQGFYLFSAPGNFLPVLLHNSVGALSWSASNLVCNNIQLSYSTDENRAGSIAVFSCVTALAGTFLGIMAGGSFLEWMQDLQQTGSVTFDRYKVLIALAVAMRVVTVLILVPGVENNTGHTVKTMITDLMGQAKTRLRLRRQRI